MYSLNSPLTVILLVNQDRERPQKKKEKKNTTPKNPPSLTFFLLLLLSSFTHPSLRLCLSLSRSKSKEAELDVRGSECDDTVPQEPCTDPDPPGPSPAKANVPTATATAGVSMSNPSSSHSSSRRSGLGGISIVSSSAEGAGESSMQFSTRPPSAEQPGFMGTWQQQSTDSNLLYRMSQQVRQLRLTPSSSPLPASSPLHSLHMCSRGLHFYVSHLGLCSDVGCCDSYLVKSMFVCLSVCVCVCVCVICRW